MCWVPSVHGVVCHFLLQGIFMTWKGTEPGSPALQMDSLLAEPGQSSLSAGALRYRAWAQSWSSAALAARSVLPSTKSKEATSLDLFP